MADRRLTIGIPIWVRVSGIIALVLVGVFLSSMWLSGVSAGANDGGRMQGMGHSGGQTGPAAPCSDQTLPTEGRPSDGAASLTPTPPPGGHGSRGH
ncbi:MAG: hypothetical protein HYU30_05890 [Chloroflexi bacterium]|nr:hypothetical protein [Chloroflexota bacterium]